MTVLMFLMHCQHLEIEGSHIKTEFLPSLNILEDPVMLALHSQTAEAGYLSVGWSFLSFVSQFAGLLFC